MRQSPPAGIVQASEKKVMDVSAAIREITDREQIRELAHQYWFGSDGGNLRELADLFAESARLIIEYPGAAGPEL